LTEIEVLKRDCQRKGDINHGLRIEIKDKEKELKLLNDEIILA
jgi:histidinol-phosphate/aromatic aminotransferase/cobyric acid decarboxylase-like protein